jgi:hypothetical protein
MSRYLPWNLWKRVRAGKILAGAMAHITFRVPHEALSDLAYMQAREIILHAVEQL